MVNNFFNYIKLLRIGHWPKQIFLIPGFIYAIYLHKSSGIYLDLNSIIYKIIVCFFITSIASSANYCINEYLDAKYDKFHPLKKDRPSVQNKISPWILVFMYLFLTLIILFLSFTINFSFFLSALVFLISGILYNVKPFRTKDIKIIDVLSESFNNPIRLSLGYTIFIDNFNIPIFLILSYWLGGAFLMACKRMSEKLYLKNEEIIKKYRPSISKYSLKDLKIHIAIYSFFSLLFLFLFLNPISSFYSFLSLIFSILFLDYYNISVKLTSDIQTPEKLFFNPNYILKITLFFIFVLVLILIYEIN